MSTTTDLPGVYRRAAYIIQMNGHHQGDYVPDPFNRYLTTPKLTRPMSVSAAMFCASSPTGQMHESELAFAAIRNLAGRVLVDGEGPYSPDRSVECEIHLSQWEDIPGRTAGEVIRLLLDAADALDRAAHASLIGVGLRTSDGSLWELEAVAQDGTPHYVLAGCHGAPEGVFADATELVDRFGSVSASGRAA